MTRPHQPDPVLACLVAARKRITPRKAWTKGVSARDAALAECDPAAPEATCWCSHGALVRSSPDDVFLDARNFMEKAVIKGHGRLDEWNDAPRRTHKQVLAAFDKAIKLRKQAAKAKR